MQEPIIKQVLQALAIQEKPITTAELVSYMGKKNSSRIAKPIFKFVKRGWINKTQEKGKYAKYQITEQGKEALKSHDFTHGGLRKNKKPPSPRKAYGQLSLKIWRQKHNLPNASPGAFWGTSKEHLAKDHLNILNNLKAQ